MKIKTNWDLSLLYKSNNDPKIASDLKMIEQACSAFEKKYKGKNFTSSPEALAKAYADFEKLNDKLGEERPAWYFSLKKDLNATDNKSRAFATKYGQQIDEALNKIKFFGLDIAKIDPQKHQAFLKHPKLKPYIYALERVFKHAKFNLSEGEEQLKSLLAPTSYSMWVSFQQKQLNQQTVEHKGKSLPIAEAIMRVFDLPKAERRLLHKKINQKFKTISHLAEGEINAIFNYKKVMDKRRGYEKPYSSTVLGNENDEKAIEALVATVTKHFGIAHRFYKLQAKLLGEKKISLVDRSVKIGEIKTKFDFPTSVKALQTTLSQIDKEYLEIFNNFLERGQIDVFPKKGKKGGAYCWGGGQQPTFVLLNHVDDMRSLETLAHEMGHAIHTELSKKQPPRYRSYSTATAEVASTFFEQIISAEIEKQLSNKERIIMLHNKITGDISTIFRQIAFFNFELELHNKIRKAGEVSKEEMAEMMNKHFKSYLGEAVKLTPDDGYFFVYLSHIRRFFYVYTYAYGQIVSRALYEKWKADPAYASKIKTFLSAGCSMSPEDIFKSIGIDTTKPDFFEVGLKAIEKDIVELEKLSKK